MEGYDETTYGDRMVDVYDDWYGDITPADLCADVLADLAAGGPVLELGVGTGRLAIPLAERAGEAEVGAVDSGEQHRALFQLAAQRLVEILVLLVAADRDDDGLVRSYEQVLAIP